MLRLVNCLRSFAAVCDNFVSSVLTIGVKTSPIGNISLGVHVYNKNLASKFIQARRKCAYCRCFRAATFSVCHGVCFTHSVPSTWNYLIRINLSEYHFSTISRYLPISLTKYLSIVIAE